MAIVYNDKVYRNLQEQVLKNQEDIDRYVATTLTLNNMGIRVLGILSDSTKLPPSASQYGDAYLVGTTAPYNLYIWTRLEAQDAARFVSVGQFPAPSNIPGKTGPQGPQGDTGVGIANIYVDSSGYMKIIYTDDRPDSEFGSLKGPQGAMGPKGPKGDKGDKGEQGPRGLDGENAFAVTIVDTLTSIDQLPSPSIVGRNDAYVVKSNNQSDLYGLVSENGTLKWANFGTIAVQGGYATPADVQAVQNTVPTNLAIDANKLVLARNGVVLPNQANLKLAQINASTLIGEDASNLYIASFDGQNILSNTAGVDIGNYMKIHYRSLITAASNTTAIRQAALDILTDSTYKNFINIGEIKATNTGVQLTYLAVPADGSIVFFYGRQYQVFMYSSSTGNLTEITPNYVSESDVNDMITANLESYATITYVDTKIGDINTVLDQINGEVI